MNPIDTTPEDYVQKVKGKKEKGSKGYLEILRHGGGSTEPVTLNVQKTICENRIMERPAHKAILLHGISEEMFACYERLLKEQGDNPDKVRWKVKKFRRLIAYVEKEGIEVITEGRPYPIEAWVTKTGRIQFVEGGHRLAIMNHYGVTETKALIMARHPDFLAFYNRVTGRYKNPTFSYHPIDHVDFEGWNFGRDREYFHQIAGLLRPRSTVLDVGSNMGYMSYAAWLRGCDVDSIEHTKQWIQDNTYLREMYGANYNIIRGVAPNHPSVRDRYDVVLMLSVIHHLMKKNPQSAVDFLNSFAHLTDMVMMDFGGRGKFTDADLLSLIMRETPFKGVFKTQLTCRVNRRHLYVLFTEKIPKSPPLCSFPPHSTAEEHQNT